MQNKNNLNEDQVKEYDVVLNLIDWDSIPDLNLYSEQVVQIINESLSGNIIFGKKVDFTQSYITSAMINYYVKRELIEAPENKKYSRIQIAKLIVISLLKQVYKTDEIIRFLDITYKAAPLERAYKSFSTLMLEGIRSVFLEGEPFYNKDFDIDRIREEFKKDRFVIETEEQHLLKNVTLSIANKIYIVEYLNRLKK